MKRQRAYTLYIYTAALAALFLMGCGEDRTHEYYDLIAEQTWTMEKMQEVYLWYEDLPELEEKKYFSAISTFFAYLPSSSCRDGSGDSYSYVDTESCEDTPLEASVYIDSTSSYGFEFLLMTDPTGTTARTVARVLMVVEGSPADRAGLVRGDWVITVDDAYFTSSKHAALLQGDAATFKVNSLVITTDENDKTTYTWDTAREVTVAASEALTYSPIVKTSVMSNVEGSGLTVGYMLYDRFDPDYNDELQTTFATFRQAGVTDFVLDLRYNTGGTLSCVEELCSYIAPTSALGETLYALEYNDKFSDQNCKVAIPTTHVAENLGLSRLVVLTSANTASASEIVISALSCYMDVYVVGATTAGKNVVLQGIASPYDFTIHPVVAAVYDSNGEALSASGISADYTYKEKSDLNPLCALGTEEEAMLQLAIDWLLE